MRILDRYQCGPLAPMAGWQPDRTVILAVRALLTDILEGFAEDILPGECDLPDGIGAVVTCDRPGGVMRPVVYVRADQPTGLRADLWGFCTALAVLACEGRFSLPAGECLFIGNERSPVRRVGAALLGALILQWLGRKPGDCDFPIYTWAGQAGTPRAAA
ncbi:hypothetical protein ACFYNO_24835 [Kitasatospora sp. NPDC006697]|uniref:hypothetical protein n=1 Tax=Kitasatospora sp. NPDC006697 TaxID=3364020 RepID=UPI0036CF4C0C